MFRRAMIRLGMAALLAATLAAAPARANWGSFVALDGTFFSEPSCAPSEPGIVSCGYVGPSQPYIGGYTFYPYNGVLAAQYTTAVQVGGSSGWTNDAQGGTNASGYIGGNLFAGSLAPSCVSPLTGALVCGFRLSLDAAFGLSLPATGAFDLSGDLVAYIPDNEFYVGDMLGGASTVPLGSLPSCAVLGPGKVLCAGRSPSGTLVAATGVAVVNVPPLNDIFTGSVTWTAVPALATAVYSPVSCAGLSPGHVVCAWLGKGSTVATATFAGGKWGGVRNLGGIATQPPSCAASGVADHVVCVITGTDTALWANTCCAALSVGTPWSGWHSLGGVVQSYSCAQYGSKAKAVNYVCGAIGLQDNNFYTNQFNGTSWGGWVSHGGGPFIGRPDCLPFNTATTPGQVMCVLLTPDGSAASIIGP